MEYGSVAVCWQLGTTMKRTHAHIQTTREYPLKNFSFYIQLINFYRIAFSSSLADDFSSVSTRIPIFRMKFSVFATESMPKMPSNFSSIRLRFLRKSHNHRESLNKQFSRCKSIKLKIRQSSERWKRHTISHTCCQINGPNSIQFTLGHYLRIH